MKIPFSLSEFLIEPTKEISVEIADKIYKNHIIPILEIRKKLGFPIFPSKRSGYRSKEYEISKGRSGGSQHTFVDRGAVDWTCFKFSSNKGLLLSELIKHSEYTRIAVYKKFIHCDYKETGGERQLFASNENSEWVFIKYF